MRCRPHLRKGCESQVGALHLCSVTISTAVSAGMVFHGAENTILF